MEAGVPGEIDFEEFLAANEAGEEEEGGDSTGDGSSDGSDDDSGVDRLNMQKKATTINDERSCATQ